MSLSSAVDDLASRIAAEFKSVRTALAGKASATHAGAHGSGGTDPVTPAAIGAATSGHSHGPATPAAHAASHSTVGSDPISLASIGAVPTSRSVLPGTGLTGGGDLSADRTLTVAYGSAAGTAVQGNDARVTADQAAATASIRTLGTGALQAAAGNHAHASGTPVAARIRRASTGNGPGLTAGSYSSLGGGTFDTTDRNDGCTINLTAGSIAVSVAGWYSIAAHARFAVGSNEFRQIIVVDGSSNVLARGSFYSTTTAEVDASGLVYLAAGTVLTVQVYTASAANLIGHATASYTVFSVALLAATVVELGGGGAPAAHAASHGSGGSDPITPASIGAAPTSRSLTAGTGLTGGGDLSADRAFAVAYGATAGTAVQGNDARATADQAAETASIRTLGTGALQACAGNDARLSDARTPTAHAHAGADISTGTVAYARLPVGTGASTIAAGDDSRITGAVPSTRTVSAGTGLTGGGDLSADRTLTVAYGTTSTTACVGNDARLSDARTPTAHNHAGSEITSGTVDTARLPNLLSTVRTVAPSAGAIAIDANTSGNNIDSTLTGDATLNVPTNGAAGQVVQGTVLASGAQRVLTFHASFGRLTGIGATLTIPSGKLGRYSIRRTDLTGSAKWLLEAVGVEQ